MGNPRRSLDEGLTVPGREFAAAWLNVMQAADEDPARPMLYRTAALEVHTGGGLRLTSTDSVLLLTQTVGRDIDRDEAPLETVVVSDADQRGHHLLKWVHKLARIAAKNGSEEPEVRLRTSRPVDPDTPSLSPDLERLMLTVSIASESVDLDVIEGDYPTWRSLFPTEEREVPRIYFNGPNLARLGKFIDQNDETLRLSFCGALGVCRITAEHSLEGLIMPVRVAGEVDA